MEVDWWSGSSSAAHDSVTARGLVGAGGGSMVQEGSAAEVRTNAAEYGAGWVRIVGGDKVVGSIPLGIGTNFQYQFLKDPNSLY